MSLSIYLSFLGAVIKNTSQISPPPMASHWLTIIECSPAISLRIFSRSWSSFISEVGKCVIMLFILWMKLLRYQLPLIFIDLGKKGIGFKGTMNARKFNLLSQINCHFIDLPPTNNERLRIISREFNCPFNRMYYHDPTFFIIFFAGDHNMGAIWKRLRKRLKCLPSHYNMMARGKLFETPEIIGQMPHQVVILSQCVVFTCCSNYCKHIICLSSYHGLCNPCPWQYFFRGQERSRYPLGVRDVVAELFYRVLQCVFSVFPLVYPFVFSPILYP